MKMTSFLTKVGVISLAAGLCLPFSAHAALDTGTLSHFIGESVSGALNPTPINGKITCVVEASNTLVGTTKNEVAYKLKYTSNYSQLNASYALQAGSPENFLDEKKGSFSMVKGTNMYVPLTAANGTERRFTYDIAGNPSITIQANIKGVKCTSKVLQTKKPAVSNVNAGVAAGSNVNTQINGANIQPSQVAINLPTPQKHSCQVLAEAMKVDDDTLRIGAGIKFQDLAKGKINYSIRGFLSNSPSQIKEYTGVYTNLTDGASGIIVDQGLKGFIFEFNAKTPLDQFVVTATIGNVDCKLLYFASPVKLQADVNAPNLNVNLNNVPADNSNNNSGNGSVAGSNNNGNGGAQVAGGNEVVQPVGLDADAQTDLDGLSLVGDDVSSGDKVQGDATATQNVVVGEESDDQNSDDTGRMYILYGLLGSIVVAGGAYGILRYKGMI